MEYATIIGSDQISNDQFIKHVGFVDTLSLDNNDSSCLREFFSKKNRDKVSCKITELLSGVDCKNRNIIVPDKTIASVMSAVYENFRPETSDIYSRYNIPQGGSPDYLVRLNDQVINIITSDVKNNLGMDSSNSKLTIWTTVLGDFNAHGLRSYPPIKLKERRPSTMLFNMNY